MDKEKLIVDGVECVPLKTSEIPIMGNSDFKNLMYMTIHLDDLDINCYITKEEVNKIEQSGKFVYDKAEGTK